MVEVIGLIFTVLVITTGMVIVRLHNARIERDIVMHNKEVRLAEIKDRREAREYEANKTKV